MKAILLIFLMVAAVWATDIKGNINTLVGKDLPAATDVEFNLLACRTPRVSEVASKPVRLYFQVPKDAAGNISGFVLGNDKIACSASRVKSSAYNITIRDGNTVYWSRTYRLTGDAFDINTAKPLN